MNLLLAFVPFIAFAATSHVAGVLAGLVAGAAVSALLNLRELVRGRTPKLLELGTLLLFVGLCLYTVMFDPAWTLLTVRLVVDAGLLLIVLGSLAIGRPFTLQYAQEQVPEALWSTPEFVERSRRIALVWAAAFVVLVAADLLLILLPQLSPLVGILLTIGALIWAMRRTRALSVGT